jgi:hypothetical protein
MRTPEKEFLLSRRDCEGRFTLRKIHHACPKSRSKDFTTVVLLATVQLQSYCRELEKGGRETKLLASHPRSNHTKKVHICTALHSK